MTFRVEAPSESLLTLLRRLALAPNSKVAAAHYQRFAELFPEVENWDLAHDSNLSNFYQHATQRLSRMETETVPEGLQLLMQRVGRLVHGQLAIDPVLAQRLRELGGEDALCDSCVPGWMQLSAFFDGSIQLPDVESLLASDWTGTLEFDVKGAVCDPATTLRTFFMLVTARYRQNCGPKLSYWEGSRIAAYAQRLTSDLEGAFRGQLMAPTQQDLSALAEHKHTKYIPIGWCDREGFCMSLLAIRHSYGESFSLRLLTADGRTILAPGEKEGHFCPEVLWSNVSGKQLLDPGLWKPLLEVATLTRAETHDLRPDCSSDELAFDSAHLVPWLTKKLGLRPQVYDLNYPEDGWSAALSNRYHKPKYWFTPQSASQVCGNVDRALTLANTGKDMKSAAFLGLHLRKFVNLLALDLLCREDYLLFKAELRLIVLSTAYCSLQKGMVPPFHRGKLLRLMDLSLGKVSAPLEKLQSKQTSAERSEACRRLLISALDLKQRLNQLQRVSDQIRLVPSRALYPSLHVPWRVDLSHLKARAIELQALDTVLLAEGLEPIPRFECLSPANAAQLHKALERWYEFLLDAKYKSEPAELIALAHRQVFSRLPIPRGRDPKALFPEEMSEGLQLGIMLTLKRMSSLIAAEVYDDHFVPPSFMADTTQVFRFCIELYRNINLSIVDVPIS